VSCDGNSIFVAIIAYYKGHTDPCRPSAQQRLAAFAVTDARWLRGQAFQKLALRVVEGGLKVDAADSSLARGLYAKPASKQ